MSAFSEFSHLILTTSLRSRHYYESYFSDGETEAHRNEMSSSGSHAWEVERQGWLWRLNSSHGLSWPAEQVGRSDGWGRDKMGDRERQGCLERLRKDMMATLGSAG